MTKILLLGATGAVGRAALALLLTDGDVDVVAPTRRPLPPAPRLSNPVGDLTALTSDGPLWRADGMISALGTTQKLAGSREAFHRVDHDLVLATAEAARRAGTPALAVVSSVGASTRSPSFYLRTKGETEVDLVALGFPSLTIVRPSMIDAPDRDQPRPGEALGAAAFRLLRPLVPARYRAVTPRAIAACLIEAVQAARPGTRLVESEAIGQG